MNRLSLSGDTTGDESGSIILLKDTLWKRGRGRSMSSVLSGMNWTKRIVHLCPVEKKIMYFENDKLKGEMPLTNAFARHVPPADADKRENAFEVTNPAGDSIIFQADSLTIAVTWIDGITAVVNNRWSTYRDSLASGGSPTSDVVEASSTSSVLTATHKQKHAEIISIHNDIKNTVLGLEESSGGEQKSHLLLQLAKLEALYSHIGIQ